jgi:hypothetical protein
MFMSKRQIVSAYNKGFLEDVAKQLRAYASITDDKEWEEDSGYHAGCHRVQHFQHHGYAWELHLHNGEVKALGYTL